MMQCDVWLIVGTEGGYATGTTYEAAKESYDDIVGEEIARVLLLDVKVPEGVPVEVVVPAETMPSVVVR